ncbi:thyroid receptor-interacting protein 11-like isoform X2 [Canis lupus familiaris]|uniref:Thyroid hormone receptor interactor 11 n=1 Tax=Canis lupus familiaris TaxID=9615 RepID=A0A8C0M4G3_CANLF|nr:thyroid receptor-interacting protein 11-like isoform X2 [Canis lupus familiaris]
MLSWTRGLGSDLGRLLGQADGSTTSLTGHIFNVTRDVLMKGREKVDEVPDSGRKEDEVSRVTLTSENERLKTLCSDLEEKYEASQLQLKQQSASYQHQLQQKQVEIALLREKQQVTEEQLLKLQSAALWVNSGAGGQLSAMESPSSSYDFGHHASPFHGDAMDVADVIWSQQEINRLSNEVLRLEAEVSHWKRLSQASLQGTNSLEPHKICKLQNTIKELEQKRSKEIEDHQLEMAALQNVHQQKLADVIRRCRKKLNGHEKKVEELQSLLRKDTCGIRVAGDPPIEDLQKTIQVLQTEKAESTRKMEELEERIQSLSDQLSSAESERDVLRRGQDQTHEEKKDKIEECELQPSVSKRSDAGVTQESVLSQSTPVEEVFGLQEALSDAEKETMRLCSANQDNDLTEDNLKLPEPVHIVGQENSSLSQGKEELQLPLSKVNKEQEVTERTAPGDITSHSEVNPSRRDPEANEQNFNQRTTEEESLVAASGEPYRQNGTTLPRASMEGQLPQQENEGSGITIKLRQEVNEEEKRACQLEDETNATTELDVQKEKSIHSELAANDLHRPDQSERCHFNIQGSFEPQEHSKQNEKALCSATEELMESLKQDSPSHSEDDLVKERETELRSLEQKVSEMERLNDNLNKHSMDLREENQKLVLALKDTRHQLEQSILHSNEDSLGKNTALRALKRDKGHLIATLCRAEKKLLEATNKYHQTIKELSSTQNPDHLASPLEHAHFIQVSQEKDVEILHLKKSLEQMDADHKETQEILAYVLEVQKQLTQVVKEKDICIDSLKGSPELPEDLEKYTQALKRIEILQQTVEEKDTSLTCMIKENIHLKEELERLKHQSQALPKLLDDIVELECEVLQLNELRVDLEDEIKEQQKIINDQQQGKIRLLHSLEEQKWEVDDLRGQQEQMTSEHTRLLSAKDEEIQNLQDTVERIKAQLADPGQHAATQPSDVVQVTTRQHLSIENGSEKHDFSKAKTERLAQGVKDQELEVKLLTEKNIRLTEQIDLPSQDEIGKLTQIIEQKDAEIQGLWSRISAASHGQHVEQLQQQLQESALQSQRVLAVLEDKTRENSNLKREYHKVIDIIASREADLRKMQEENKKLATRTENRDQDVFRETIQHLSHIIRERDLEVDALKQKCQTLLTILQTSSTANEVRGVPMDRFKELLEERDTFRQRVKIMEEWRQQVTATVQNMKRESPRLQELLRQQQVRALTNINGDSELEMTYMDVIRDYRGNENKLRNLEKELAQIQLSIGELCNAQDHLLGKPDVSCLQPSTESSESEEPLKAFKSDSATESPPWLQEEVEELRKSVQDRETTIRTLQEDNQRLMDCAAATSELKRKAHERADSKIQQLREKEEVLQNLIQAKELLIQAKSEELHSLMEDFTGQVSENELLRQAVRNLKERIADLEMDVCQLKEEKEKTADSSREKEAERQALQETNMRLSKMWQEEESHHAAIKEKALALEQLLKEREEGEAGELNQLIDAVTSAQEKAVVFQQERDGVLLALKRKQMENGALQDELQQLRDKELHLNQELERTRRRAVESEDTRQRESLLAEDKVAKLRKEVAVLEEKLAVSSNATARATHQASMQVESLREQLHVITRQKEETAAQLSALQEQGKQYAQTLASLKSEVAEWMDKTDTLEGKLKSLQARLTKTNTVLDLKEDKLEALRKRNEVQQEVLDDTQKKLMNLVSSSEGMVDKTLVRRLLLGCFRAPRRDHREALQLMSGTLGIKEEDVRQLCSEEQGGVIRCMTGGLGSKSTPKPPVRPDPQPTPKSSFAGLFVNFLEGESDLALLPRSPSAPDKKPPNSVGKGKGTKEKGPPRQTITLGSTPPKKAAKPRATAVSLTDPRGLETDGSQHLLLNAVTNALPTYTPLILSPASKVGIAARGLSNQ